MGFHIRKSIKLSKHLKLNLNKSGVSLSGGVKGARVSLNSKGVVRKSVGLPGTGIYYTDQHKISGGKSKSRMNSITNSNVIQTATATAPRKTLKKINLIRMGVISLALCIFKLAPMGIGIFMFCLAWNYSVNKNNKNR